MHWIFTTRWPRAMVKTVATALVAVFFTHTSLAVAQSAAAIPSWWTERGVIAPDAAADDYAVINQGQLKNIARAACDELNANLPGGAGEVINDLVSSWQVSGAQTEDFAVVTQGQLKALAAPFYERLVAAGLAEGVPWAGATTQPDHYALANIGQAKQLFSFVLPPPDEGAYGSGSSSLPLTLTVLSGNNQAVTAGAAASGPLVVRATRAGLPWAGVVVTFQASGGNLGGSGTPSKTVTTSTSGDASVSYAAPSSSGSTQTISAAAESATATFSVNVLPQSGGGGGAIGGSGSGDLPPPEEQTGFKLFTAWRYKQVDYQGGQEAVYPLTPVESDPDTFEWMKPGEEPDPPRNDGFNGDADEQGNLKDPGDPRDSFSPIMIAAEEGEAGAVQVLVPGNILNGGEWTGEAPTAEDSSLYTATNLYNPPDRLTSSDAWSAAKAMSMLSDVPYYKDDPVNGWMGNGYRGLGAYQVYSMLRTNQVKHPYTTTDSMGFEQPAELIVQQTTAHAGEGQLRLQCNQERTSQDEPLIATFVLIKETQTIGGTSAAQKEFQAAIQLKIVTGTTSTQHVLVNGQLPQGDDVIVTSGVITVRSPAPVDGKILRYYLLPIDIVPDWNRDGKINAADRGKVSTEKPWRFWVNDDNDDNETDGDDIPNSAGGNGLDMQVNKMRDLDDFFPLWLDIGAALNSMPETDYDYVLESDTHALQFIETELVASDVKKFLTGELGSTSVMDNPNAIALHSTIKAVFQQQGKLSQTFLTKAKTGGRGVLLIEAFKPTQRALKLVIRKKSDSGSTFEFPMPLNIQSVEKMYRHLNLLAAAGGSGGRPDEMEEPPNYPDDLCNTKNFVFLHGYNVNPEQARGWAAETFKRLWWSGSKAKYVAVTWHGSETQESTDGAATPNYYVNVDNAFATAEALKNALADLPGEKMVAAHSLGNMVVGSALSDWDAPIDKYIAIDGAVAMESWDGGAAKSNDMVHLDWDNPQTQGTYPERLWSSEWYQLWPTGDARNKLTWRERVGNHRSAQVFNFYSSGEEVLAAHPHADMPDISDILTSGVGRYAWALGEKTKGRMHTDLVMGSHSGGWGFSSAYDTTKDDQGNPVYPLTLPDPGQTASITDAQLRAEPFFRAKTFVSTDLDPALFGADGSQYAQEHRNTLLARAFPARTLPVGANAVPALGSQSNFDMNQLFKSGWPQSRLGDPSWLHSDVRVVAYTYIYKMFDKIVALGGLNQ